MLPMAMGRMLGEVSSGFSSQALSACSGAGMPMCPDWDLVSADGDVTMVVNLYNMLVLVFS